MDALTFGLALLGYALLGLDVVLRACGRAARPFAWVVASVVAAHVALVWGHRFGWSLTYALDKSLVGFAVFHLAFALVVARPLLGEPWSTRVLLMSFVVVTCGATGATFVNEAVYALRVPVIGVAVGTAAAVSTTHCWARR